MNYSSKGDSTVGLTSKSCFQTVPLYNALESFDFTITWLSIGSMRSQIAQSVDHQTDKRAVNGLNLNQVLDQMLSIRASSSLALTGRHELWTLKIWRSTTKKKKKTTTKEKKKTDLNKMDYRKSILAFLRQVFSHKVKGITPTCYPLSKR